ncbi:MAG: hypothetical protein NUW23_00905 [Firmicutes bacterium]|jgi:lipid-A-disaccharide synthase|nr:hypothetical protein [Bacillota bacterium]
MDVVLVSSSPGQILGWVRPVAERAFSAPGVLDVWVLLTPGQFSTGHEVEVASTFPGVRRVVRPLEFLFYLAVNKRPQGFAPSAKGVVVHLGGDMAYSVLLSRRLRYPLVSYSTGAASWVRAVSKFLAEDERVQTRLIARGVPADRVRAIGNLTIDAVAPTLSREDARKRLGIDESQEAVCLLPGSRPREVEVMGAFLCRVAELLSKVHRNVRFVLPLSPFTDLESLGQALASTRHRHKIDGSNAVLEQGDGSIIARTAEGVEIVVETDLRYDAMLSCDMAICPPGTVSGELSFLGVPHVVVMPLNVPGAVPISGMLGFATRVPLAGDIFKKYALDRIRAKARYVAAPNVKAKRLIVPEVVGEIRPEDVVIPSVELLGDAARRERIGRELREVIGGPGAADRLIHEIRVSMEGAHTQDEKEASAG